MNVALIMHYELLHLLSSMPELHQHHIEAKHRTGWNCIILSCAVAQLIWNIQVPAVAQVHLLQCRGPSGNHSVHRKLGWSGCGNIQVATVRRVKLIPSRVAGGWQQTTTVVHPHGVGIYRRHCPPSHRLHMDDNIVGRLQALCADIRILRYELPCIVAGSNFLFRCLIEVLPIGVIGILPVRELLHGIVILCAGAEQKGKEAKRQHSHHFSHLI